MDMYSRGCDSGAMELELSFLTTMLSRQASVRAWIWNGLDSCVLLIYFEIWIFWFGTLDSNVWWLALKC